MMRIGEHDFELLEEYLDEALGDSARRDLDARLAVDASLADALGDLSTGRILRAELFASLEPDAASERKVIDRINAAILHDDMKRRRWSGWGRVSSLAAGIIVAFLAGWMCHRIFSPSPSPANAGGSLAVTNPGYQVQITDDAGRVVAVQKFTSLEQAREFTDDMTKWQLRQQQLQQGQVVLVGDTF